MPLIYLAHQAPLLPIVRRWPRSVDGLALVVGSMAPDFAYALNGTRFELFAHVWPGLLTFCVPVTLVVAWLVARGLARVVAGHLPELSPPFRSTDRRERAPVPTPGRIHVGYDEDSTLTERLAAEASRQIGFSTKPISVSPAEWSIARPVIQPDDEMDLARVSS